MKVDEVQTLAQAIREEIAKAVVGQETSVELMLVEGPGLPLLLVQPAAANAAHVRTAVMIAAGLRAVTNSSTPPAWGDTR